MIMRRAQDDGKKYGEDDEMDNGDYGKFVGLSRHGSSMDINGNF